MLLSFTNYAYGTGFAHSGHRLTHSSAHFGNYYNALFSINPCHRLHLRLRLAALCFRLCCLVTMHFKQAESYRGGTNRKHLRASWTQSHIIYIKQQQQHTEAHILNITVQKHRFNTLPSAPLLSSLLHEESNVISGCRNPNSCVRTS